MWEMILDLESNQRTHILSKICRDLLLLDIWGKDMCVYLCIHISEDKQTSIESCLYLLFCFVSSAFSNYLHFTQLQKHLSCSRVCVKCNWSPLSKKEVEHCAGLRRCSVWTWGRTSSLWGWRSTGTGCPGRLWSLLLWRYSRPAWTRSCAACCMCPCFGRGIGLDDPQRSLPTPTILWFCDSHQ